MRSGGAWQRVPVTAILIRHGRREAAWATGYAVFYLCAAFAIGEIILVAPRPIWGASRFNQDVWYAVVLKIGLLLIVPVAALRLAGYGPADFLLGWQEDRRRILRLPLAYLLGVVVNIGHLPDIRAAYAGDALGHSPARVALGAVLPLFTAGLPEEIFFRGILQTRIEAVLGRLRAVGITAVMFAAWHLPTRYLLSHGGEGEAGSWASVLLSTGLPVLIVGLILGLAWDRWRNLPTLVAVHWGIDTLPTVASFLGINF